MRIIINNHAGISDTEAIHYVSEVIKMGKISKRGNGEMQYCYATGFRKGNGRIVVTSIRPLKNGNRFDVLRYEDTCHD